jgi:hypothetical protein
MCPWIGDDFGPQAFSIDQINRLALSDAAPTLPRVAPSSSLRRLPERTPLFRRQAIMRCGPSRGGCPFIGRYTMCSLSILPNKRAFKVDSN